MTMLEKGLLKNLEIIFFMKKILKNNQVSNFHVYENNQLL